MSLLRQVKCINDLKTYVELCHSEAKSTIDKVNTTISTLEKKGLPIEICEKIKKNDMQNINGLVDTMLEELKNSVYPFLEEVERRLRIINDL